MRRLPLLQKAAAPLLWPFVLLYAMGVRLKNALYMQRILKPQRLAWPVVSVGNLSVGGTGKTPLVMLLARLMQQRGWSVDVLSRGYGRSSSRVLRVDPQGGPDEFGDEPLLMARCGMCVYVAPQRYLAGLMAEENPETTGQLKPRVHVLDDGFQHRKLARSLDIVLLQRADLRDEMLPVGRLREPLSALERADIAVLRAEDADLADQVRLLMRRKEKGPARQRIWLVERKTVLPVENSTRRVLAFCGIGDPAGFFQGLRQTGIPLVEAISFSDHHVYTERDIDRLKTAARRANAERFVTTEKDSIRLPQSIRADLETACPLLIAGLELSLQREAQCMDTLEKLLIEKLQTRKSDVR